MRLEYFKINKETHAYMAYGKIYKSQTGKQTDGQEDTDRRKQTDRQTDRQTETDRRIQTDRQNFPNILKMNENVS